MPLQSNANQKFAKISDCGRRGFIQVLKEQFSLLGRQTRVCVREPNIVLYICILHFQVQSNLASQRETDRKDPF